jgi:phospholipid/cholesterol/gamma-HCH transport system substrate-binding protein
MTLNNETKIGALTIVAVTCLVLGFNFLKGKALFTKTNQIFAKYQNIAGLLKSNAVFVNGYQIGTVAAIEPSANLKELTVTINLNKGVNLPSNSVALIKSNPLGATTIDVVLGNATTALTNGSTINTQNPGGGLLDAAMSKLDPVLGGVKTSLGNLDSLLLNINSVVDGNAKANIQQLLNGLNSTAANLTKSSAALNGILSNQTGALATTLNNVSSFTGNLSKNNDAISAVMGNLQKTTDKFANIEITQTLDNVNNTLNELKNIVAKLNTSNGTAGLLLNDARLYNNLAATTNKINTLLDDVRTHPKRYINVSVFGRKDKRTPLETPLPDTLNAPYIKN